MSDPGDPVITLIDETGRVLAAHIDEELTELAGREVIVAHSFEAIDAIRRRPGGGGVTLRATVPGRPVPYARARSHGSRRFHTGPHAAWERAALPILRAVAPPSPLEGPLACRLLVVHPRPTRTPKSAPQGLLTPRATRCDLDNVIKLALDCAVKAGWLVDDNHVQRIEAAAYYAEADAGPRVELELWRMDA